MEVPALSSALLGMSRAESQLNQAASDIARAPVASNGQDIVDLSAAMVALLQSRNNFEANANIFKAVDQMDRALLNIIA